MSADVESANRDGISEEVTCAWCAASNAGTWIDPGIDRWGARLKCPLRGRLANAMITQTIDQWILVVNPMRLRRRIRRKGAQRVEPEVVIAYPGEERESRPIWILDSSDDQVIPEGHWACPKLGCPT